MECTWPQFGTMNICMFLPERVAQIMLHVLRLAVNNFEHVKSNLKKLQKRNLCTREGNFLPTVGSKLQFFIKQATQQIDNCASLSPFEDFTG